MDAFEFDSMDPIDKWEYFWEYGIYQDSANQGDIDYFLFRHKEQKELYMELFISNKTSERGIKMIGGGEALVKYEFGHGDKPAPPWA